MEDQKTRGPPNGASSLDLRVHGDQVRECFASESVTIRTVFDGEGLSRSVSCIKSRECFSDVETAVGREVSSREENVVVGGQSGRGLE